MNAPIPPGYYAMLASNAYKAIEDITEEGNLRSRLLSELGKSPSGLVTQDHDTIDGLFWAWKVMRNGWILLLLGDRDHRADSPGEAYQRLMDDIDTDDDAAPLSVMWIHGVSSVVMH